MKIPYVIGEIDTEIGKIPKVSTTLSRADKWGSFKVRWSNKSRMNYKLDPGIYAIGNPNEGSLVFVSANYKLSFDVLRQELKGLDAWILVLDTKGINVWCAAGKGTFGTDEIVNRISLTGLEKIINHKKLISPQLSATGVAAHKVKSLSGFKVIYGPVRASDINNFLAAGMTTTPEMRLVRFSFFDRLVLVPMEVVGGLKFLFLVLLAFLLLSAISKSGYSVETAIDVGIRSTINILVAYLAGAALGPLLLPWLPGRSFSLKGFFTGLASFILLFLALYGVKFSIEVLSWMLLIPAISSFLTMNFTGASTYTSLSGVKKEMALALPFQISSVIIGIGLWIVSRFV